MNIDIKNLINRYIKAFEYNRDNDVFGKDAEENTRSDLEKFVSDYQDIQMDNIKKLISERIENFTGLKIEAPIEDYEKFFNSNYHLAKEVTYDLGIINGLCQSMDFTVSSIDSKLDLIVDLMQVFHDKH